MCCADMMQSNSNGQPPDQQLLLQLQQAQHMLPQPPVPQQMMQLQPQMLVPPNHMQGQLITPGTSGRFGGAIESGLLDCLGLL